MSNLKRKSCFAFALVAACMPALGRRAVAVTVDLTLNVTPTNSANPNAGGTWNLFAKTDSAFGIAAIDSYMTNINTSGLTYAAGINAALNGGSPYVIAGPTVELLYFQDVSQGGVVVGVGKPTFTPGADPFGDATWDNATRIAGGTYNAAIPLGVNNATFTTDANTLSKGTAPFTNNLDAVTTIITRVPGDFETDGDLDAVDIDALLHATQGAVPPALAKFDLSHNHIVNSTPNVAGSDADVWVRTLKHTEYGDATLDGKVDVLDLGALATHWQQNGGWADGNFNGSGLVDVLDLGLLATHWQFGVPAGELGPTLNEALASLGLPSASVPEPGVAALAFAAGALLARRRQPANR